MSNVVSLGAPERDACQSAMVEAAAGVAGVATEGGPLCGFIVLGFFSDGTTAAHIQYPDPDAHRIGSTMFEAWAQQTLDDQMRFVQSVYAAEQVVAGE